jgi:hypothetical protein
MRQSFAIALTPSAPFGPVDVQLVYSCANTAAARTISGVTTLLLSARDTRPPDIVALGTTATLDGILSIPGPAGTGMFSVATVNLGVGAEITAAADTGSASLSVALSLCQTNPANGQCINPAVPASSAVVGIETGQTPTFAVFVRALGGLAFLPDMNRVFVRFKTASGEVVGATSVAIRTQ